MYPICFDVFEWRNSKCAKIYYIPDRFFVSLKKTDEDQSTETHNLQFSSVRILLLYLKNLINPRSFYRLTLSFGPGLFHAFEPGLSVHLSNQSPLLPGLQEKLEEYIEIIVGTCTEDHINIVNKTLLENSSNTLNQNFPPEIVNYILKFV